MLVNNNIHPLQEYTLPFGSFQFYTGYVLCHIKEGEDLDAEKLLQFYSLCSDVFQEQNFAVIELRFSSFSIDPSFYVKYRYLLTNVSAHAIVVAGGAPAQLNEYEALCLKHCPCAAFYTLSDAVSWVSKQ